MKRRDKFRDFLTVIFVDSAGECKGRTSEVISQVPSDSIRKVCESHQFPSFEVAREFVVCKYKGAGGSLENDTLFKVLSDLETFLRHHELLKVFIPIDTFILEGFSKEIVSMTVNKVFKGSSIQVVF